MRVAGSWLYHNSKCNSVNILIIDEGHAAVDNNTNNPNAVPTVHITE